MSRIAMKIFLILMLTTTPCFAGHEFLEKEYQAKWCQESGGVAEYVLPDRSRVDCLTATHAIEVDFANKWAESCGQALYYSIQTGCKPGIVLILEKQSDKSHLKRLMELADKYGITVWTMEPGDMR